MPGRMVGDSRSGLSDSDLADEHGGRRHGIGANFSKCLSRFKRDLLPRDRRGTSMRAGTAPLAVGPNSLSATKAS